MTWPIPDYSEVRQAYDELAYCRQLLRSKEAELEEFKAQMAVKAPPRNPTQREYGVTAEDVERGIRLRNEVLFYKGKVEAVQAKVAFLEYVKDMYRAQVYVDTYGAKV